MRPSNCQSILVRVLLSVTLVVTLLSSSRVVHTHAEGTEIPNRRAKDCGCRELSSDEVKMLIVNAGLFSPLRTPVLLTLLAHPEHMMPHYAETGDCSGRRYPVEGTYGWVRYSHPATLDVPIDHEWHDFNFYVDYDPPYGDATDTRNVNSDANYLAKGNFLEYDPSGVSHRPLPARDQRLMEVEWDLGRFPDKFWPTAGDRFWMVGRNIWDCGHPDPPGYHNEVHPPTGVAFTHYAKDITGEAAPDTLTCQTRVFIHGKSGITHFDRFPTPDPQKFGLYDTAVATRDYDFDITLPPNTAANRQAFAKVVELPFGGPAPILTVDPSLGKVHVHYPLNLGDPSPDRKFGALIVSGWKTSVPDSPGFKQVKVTVEKILIRRRHTPLCQADWNLWLNVNGQWTKIPNTFGLIDGSTIPVNLSYTVNLPNTEDARLIVQVTGWVSMIDSLFPGRLDPLKFGFKYGDVLNGLQIGKLGDWGNIEDAANEGHIGDFFRSFSLRRDDFGVGKDYTGYPGDLSSRVQELDGEFGNDDTNGDFSVFYKITR